MTEVFADALLLLPSGYEFNKNPKMLLRFDALIR
jgi:hypothetical protein